MNEVELQLNSKTYSYAQLKSGDGAAPSTEFEKSTLRFCQEWIQGKDRFTISTSGSTGTPKLIAIYRAQMEASARLTSAALGLQAGYKALLCLDPRYIAGQMMIVRSFVTGMKIIAVEPSANPWASLPSDVTVDFAALVPYQLESILNTAGGKGKLNAVKAVLLGGALVSDSQKRQIRGLHCTCYSSYGMTETLSHVALQKLNGPDAQDYFQGLPGISFATDSRGCLTITAPYLGRESVNTNDLVEIVGYDKFRWLGRWDRVINSGGIKVFPEKVEAQCQRIFESERLTNRYFVGGVPDEKLGYKVVLVVEGAPFPEKLVQNLRGKLEAALEKYEVPKEIKFVQQFLETPTQKVDRERTLNY